MRNHAVRNRLWQRTRLHPGTALLRGCFDVRSGRRSPSPVAIEEIDADLGLSVSELGAGVAILVLHAKAGRHTFGRLVVRIDDRRSAGHIRVETQQHNTHNRQTGLDNLCVGWRLWGLASEPSYPLISFHSRARAAGHQRLPRSACDPRETSPSSIRIYASYPEVVSSASSAPIASRA